MVYLRDIDKVDYRHTVDINNSISFASAVQVNEDGSYDYVTYMLDDVRTWDNEAVIDATEQELENYRKYCRKFKKGDKIIINRGRKMRGETKVIKDMFRYTVNGTYGKQYTDYLVFTDNTKVNRQHCDFI